MLLHCSGLRSYLFAVLSISAVCLSVCLSVCVYVRMLMCVAGLLTEYLESCYSK